jgi:hypothetical protein
MFALLSAVHGAVVMILHTATLPSSVTLAQGAVGLCTPKNTQQIQKDIRCVQNTHTYLLIFGGPEHALRTCKSHHNSKVRYLNICTKRISVRLAVAGSVLTQCLPAHLRSI